MGQAFTNREAGQVVVDSTLASSQALTIGAFRRVLFYFPAAFSENSVAIYALDPAYDDDRSHASAFIDTGKTLDPSAGRVAVMDLDLIGHEQIKLVSNAEDDGQTVGWRGV